MSLPSTLQGFCKGDLGMCMATGFPDLSKWMSVDVRRKVIRSSPFQASLLAKLSDGDLGAYETSLCQELPAQQNSVRLQRLPFFSVDRTMEKLNQWPTEVSKQILQPITLQAKCWCAAFEIGIQATPRNGSMWDAMQCLTHLLHSHGGLGLSFIGLIMFVMVSFIQVVIEPLLCGRYSSRLRGINSE